MILDSIVPILRDNMPDVDTVIRDLPMVIFEEHEYVSVRYTDYPTYDGTYAVTPTEAEQTLPSADTLMRQDVVVAPIPPEYIIPTGTRELTTNGTYDVTQYASVEVDVPTEPELQSKSVTPSEQDEAVTPDAGYYGLSRVDVSAIPSDYVGTAVARPAALVVSGKTVTAPAGYYSAGKSADVQTATQATPSITVGNDGLITASAQQSEGYVVGGTKSATSQLQTQAAVTVIPGESQQTVGGAGKYMTGAVTVDPIPYPNADGTGF